MPDDTVLLRCELAPRLRVSAAWLDRNLRRLQRDHGFPRPLPGLGHRYDALAVDEWQARWRDPHAAAAPAQGTSAGGAEPDWDAIMNQRAASFCQAPGRV